jgi:hypothetical protein
MSQRRFVLLLYHLVVILQGLTVSAPPAYNEKADHLVSNSFSRVRPDSSDKRFVANEGSAVPAAYMSSVSQLSSQIHAIAFTNCSLTN